MSLKAHQCWIAMCGHCLKEELSLIVHPAGHSRPLAYVGPPKGWMTQSAHAKGWVWEEVWCPECCRLGKIGQLHPSLIPEEAA